ncbi:type IV pilin protein [Pseudomonadota bacterium]
MNEARQTGFTLIEVIIAVSIVGILATVAYPAYVDQVYKTRRSDAKASLLDTAQQFERCYTEASNFTAGVCPTGFPKNSTEGYYSISLAAGSLTASSYTLVATAQNVQVGDVQCASFTLDQLGNKTATQSFCW